MIRKINLKFKKFDCPVLEFSSDLIWKYNADRTYVGNFMMEEQLGFRSSQVIDGMLHYLEKSKDKSEILTFKSIELEDNEPYIIPVAIQYTPIDWTDFDTKGEIVVNKKSVFELIDPRFLKDLQDGRALLLLDQSVEGYSATWLWKWFHLKCEHYKINPAAIIYATGDQSCIDRYNQWASLNNINNRLKLVPSISLTTFLRLHYERRNLQINFNDILTYKTENPSKIYLYDCTNKRPRPQRVYNFLHLLSEGLLDKGNVSMPAYREWSRWFSFGSPELKKFNIPIDIIKEKLLEPGTTPREAKHNFSGSLDHYYNYVERILDDLYRHSWVSLVVESSYFDYEYSNFISEKTFKPIAAMQPFIIVGSQFTLKYLRQLGYKTFHPYIDESYDLAPDSLRFNAVVNTLKKIEQIEDKASWLNSIRDILEHNHELFTRIGSERSAEHMTISNYYFDYFKDKVNV